MLMKPHWVRLLLKAPVVDFVKNRECSGCVSGGGFPHLLSDAQLSPLESKQKLLSPPPGIGLLPDALFAPRLCLSDAPAIPDVRQAWVEAQGERTDNKYNI